MFHIFHNNNNNKNSFICLLAGPSGAARAPTASEAAMLRLQSRAGREARVPRVGSLWVAAAVRQTGGGERGGQPGHSECALPAEAAGGYIENSKNAIRKLLEIINEFGKVAECKIND